MRKIYLVLTILLFASVAYAATISASGAGPSMAQRGAAYILTLSPPGAPSADTEATSISWNWSVNTGTCFQDFMPYSCPKPAGFRVRLCWHQDADGIFWINPNDPNQCKDVTSQSTGTTWQWQHYLFNSGAKRLRMKLVFSSSGSGALSPAITTSGGVSVNF